MTVKYQLLSLVLATLIVAALPNGSEAQLLDRLMNQNYEPRDSAANPQETGLRRLLNGIQTVSVPLFYEMNKNGSSMGINVLSGLVKFERGQEAERNGLAGPRPMSVRVFGVPVYERGQRVRPPSSGSEPMLPPLGRETPNGRPNTGDTEEELPLER